MISSWLRYLYESPSFNGLIANPFITITSWPSTIFPLSIARKAHLDSPNTIPLSLENCVTKSSCCLRFRLTAMSFKSSTKNKWFMVVSSLPDKPIWYPFNFFNKNGNGLTERMNNNKNYHLGKYLEDSGLSLIGYLLHDWLSECLLTILVSKFQWLMF